MNTLKQSHFSFEGQQGLYHGKVRDVYSFENFLIMVVSDRISAFDVILPEPIPYKGQVLNQLSAHFFQATADLVPNWVTAVPDPNVTIGKKCVPFKIEMVVRGYLSGHAWRIYKAGERMLWGQPLPDGLKENDRLPRPVITPSTKAAVGHDTDISREEIIARGIIPETDYLRIEEYVLALFQRGQEMADQQGLILGDAKYEFGREEAGRIVLIDEIHTPDSARYFYKDGFEERQEAGLRQRQLSKEFVREWLMENGFQGQAGQKPPEMTADLVRSVSDRYIELYELITGKNFIRPEDEEIESRIERNIHKFMTANPIFSPSENL